MAVRLSPSPLITIQKSIPIKKPATNNNNRVLVITQCHISVQNTTPPLLQMRSSSFKNKVFEDRSKGIVCYRDDRGEITCEGYDEGPRLDQQHFTTPARITCSRDKEIINLLQKTLLQIAHKDVSGSSGFNTLC